MSQPSPIAALDEQGTVVAWSRAAQRLTGLSEAEALGRPVSDLLAAAGSGPLTEALSGGLTVGTLPGGDRRRWGVWPPDGSAVRARPAVDAAFSQSPIGLHLIGADLRILRVNRAACAMRGLPEDDILGSPVREVFARYEPALVERAVREVLTTGEPVLDLLVRGTPPADPSQEHAFAISLFRLENTDTHTMSVVAEAVDVTPRERNRERLALLHRAHEHIGHSLDAARCARELVEVAVPELAGAAFVALFDSAVQPADAAGLPGLRCVAAIGAGEDTPAVGAALDPEQFAPALTDRVPHVDRPVAGDRVLTVPLLVRDALLGVVRLRHLHPRRPFDEAGVRLVADIAAYTALCIDNAQHYERAHATALALHGSDPGSLPAGRGAVETAQRYLPTGQGAGAWFDIIPLSGARVALTVGQVHGGGPEATAVMGQLRSAIHALAGLDLDPHDLLARLHDTTRRLAAERQAVGDPRKLTATCAYAVHDPVAQRCTVARAGRQSLVLLLPDGTWNDRPLPETSPLGEDGPPFAAEEFPFPPDSTIVLLSGPDPADPGTLRQLRADLSDRPAAARDVLDRLPADQAAVLLARTRALDPADVATWDIDPELTAVAAARRLAIGQLAHWGLKELEFAAELTVSELVTNAIRHGTPPIRLRLVRNPTARTLTCEISDASPAAPHLRHARAGDEGGRGLFISGELSDSWGVRWSAEGKTVWTETEFGA
ncbi:SpoIIE family protein phosphatase [Kitasatospora sp. NPDC057015]|uniref:SpoIIE family protein phosphatase n=1 Tax=Kitasatospora sp. NPDC057015 TaxID=3346001 RepID=UPI0036357A66